MKKRLPALLLTVVLAVPLSGLAGGGRARAADGGQPAIQGGLETVIVTARKRAEDEQSIPISISAFTQDDLDRLNVRTVEDLKYVAPSVYVAPTAFRQDTLNITIRGQRNFDAPSGGGSPGLGFDTASAVYKDGVYYARAVGLSGSLFDLDNVTVLKGPQGTLVGRNATGGAVLYASRDPGPEFGGHVNLTAGDYGRGALEGAVNLPISDVLWLRVALNIDDQKGYLANYFYDPVSGYRNAQPAMGADKIAGIVSLKWQPDESFNLVLRADIAAEHDTGTSYHDLGYFVGTAPSGNAPNQKTSICNIPATCTGFTDLLGHPIAPYYLTSSLTSVGNVNTSPAAYNAVLNSVAREQAAGFWSTEQAVSNLDVGRYQTYSATASKHFEGFDAKLLASYRTWDNAGQAISRGLPYEMNTYLYQFPDYRSWQSELTLDGDSLGGALKWTAGLFYFTETSPNDGGYLYLFLPSAAGPPTAAPGKQLTITDSSRNGEENSSYAAYAQGTYSLTANTRLTAGVRYTYDERYAHIATQTIKTPSNTALAGTTFNGVFDPAPLTYLGISYAGQTQSCALVDTNGKALPLGQCSRNINAFFHKPTWTLALDHDLWAGTLVYVTSRSGYRSGAINSAAINPLVTVAAPEEVLDYEVGVKSDWALAGMPVRTNFAAYETAYHNAQVQVALPNITGASGPGGGACTQAAFNAAQCTGNFNDNITLNANRARIYGGEWDITLLPLQGVRLNWSGSYLDATYTDFVYQPPAGYLLPTGTTNLSGTPFPLPHWQTNVTASYSTGPEALGAFDASDIRFTAHYYWQSRYPADLRTYNPVQKSYAYGLLNLRLDIDDIDGSAIGASVFINNVVNTQACLPEYNGALNSAPNNTFGVANTSGVLQCVPLAPRQAGLTLRYKF